MANNDTATPNVNNRIETFLKKHREFLAEQALILIQTAQDDMAYRKKRHISSRGSDAPIFTNQASRALDLIEAFDAVTTGKKPLSTSTALERAELSELFSNALAAVGSMIKKHEQICGKVEKETDSEFLASRYRKSHHLPKDAPLEPAAQKDITQEALENRNGLAEMNAEIVTLSAIYQEIQQIRTLILPQAHKRNDNGNRDAARQ